VTSAVHAVRYPFEASTVTIEPTQYLGPISRVAFLQFVDRGLEDVTAHRAFVTLHNEHEAERVDDGRKAGAGEAQGCRAPEGSLTGTTITACRRTMRESRQGRFSISYARLSVRYGYTRIEPRSCPTCVRFSHR